MTLSIRGVVRHFHNRISEMAAALIMIGIGGQIFMAPPATDYRALDLIVVYLTSEWVAVAFITVGSVRVAALVANGHWKTYGPWMRASGAFVGSMVWSQMFLSLIVVPADQLTSLGAPAYFVFTWVELVSIYRALAMRCDYGRSG